MGSPSVSEAPRGPSGPSEKDAPAAPLGSSPLLPPAAPLPPSAPPLPPSAPPLPPPAPPLPPPAPALRLPPRVRLVGASADQLSFVGWRPPAAPLLLCPILLVLSNLSWLAPEPPGVERLLVSALGWSLTLLLAWRCRPRRARLVLRPATRQLIIGRESAGQVLMLPDTLRWRLTVEHVPELPQPHYRALLVQDDRCWPLLVNTDPAELLRDLGRVLARWPGTVEHDWPLPHESQPWSFSSASAAADPAPAAPEADARVLPGSRADRGLRWAMLIIPMLVMVDLMYLVTSASARVPVVHPLSVGLALLAAACLCSISASVLTRHPRLALGSQLAQEYSILGRRRVLHRVRAQSVRGVHVLTSSHARRGHLLVDSDEGALALLVESREARPLQEELLRSLGQPAPRPSESAVSAPRRWRSA